jgi:hypothetical protein
MDLDIEARSAAWAAEPEPSMPSRDPQTIVEAEPVAFVWNTQNETEEWLHFDGETMDVER